jgi:hypothetical protein
VFEVKWLSGGNPFLADGKVVFGGYIKTLIGLQLENPAKISALVNITSVPTPTQLAHLVNSAQAGSTTRIYCSPQLKTSIAAAYAQVMQGNGLISVSSAAEVSVLGIPIQSSFNIPVGSGYIAGSYVA